MGGALIKVQNLFALILVILIRKFSKSYLEKLHSGEVVCFKFDLV